MAERKEYPRPQFRRESWQNLNGAWEFAFDDKNEGKAQGWWKGDKKLGQKINVPFSYQYPASGINDKTVHDITWYRRTFVIEKKNVGKRVLLCFNAADYETDVWVNGIHAVTHKGGFAPFSVDITDYLNGAKNVLVVRCYDSLETTVPRGKQMWAKKPSGCHYVPNTGIWQSVWLDFFGQDCIESYSLRADIDHRCVHGEIHTMYALADEAEIVLTFQGKILQKQRFILPHKRTRFTIDFSNIAFDFNGLLWSVENPNLIAVDFTLYAKGEAVDVAHTRLGMRKIHIDENGKICLNNKPLYQRLILDQGYWEESGLTPPSAEALKRDIELAKAMGFNGARKHQKFEDPYFYYYAEELGFLTWCEMPSAYTFCKEEAAAITHEWQEILSVAKNFTSNIAYVPLNESWGVREICTDKAQQDFARSLYYLTKSIDGEKLVSTNDGFENVNPTDIVTIHDYEIEKAEQFPEKYKDGEYDGLYTQSFRLFAEGNKYEGQPVLFTEFGGMALKADEKSDTWGYNEGEESADSFYAHLTGLLQGIAQTEFQGYCYTQLTDVQQEINGLLRADHTPKFDIQKLKTIFETGKRKC
ncbi:MAG: glycoside hydrolase family 2 [Clostridia bacterium]|nr:glycoside hydrolase family 2 [Clostridia bacterium]